MKTTKNFYSLEDFSFLEKLKIDLIKDISLKDYNFYLKNLPDSESSKLQFFRNFKITMTTLMIKFSEFKVYEDDKEDYLFNFFFNTPQEKNPNPLIKNVFNKLFIGKIYDLKEKCKHYFSDTLNYLSKALGENFHSAHYMIYNNKCEVKPHNHSDVILSMNFLLNDITDGKMTVCVNEESKVLSKAGEYFIFDPMQTHSAIFEGSETIFLMVNVPNPSRLIHKNHI